MELQKPTDLKVLIDEAHFDYSPATSRFLETEPNDGKPRNRKAKYSDIFRDFLTKFHEFLKFRGNRRVRFGLQDSNFDIKKVPGKLEVKMKCGSKKTERREWQQPVGNKRSKEKQVSRTVEHRNIKGDS